MTIYISLISRLRQVEFDMIPTYKICYNLIDLKFDKFFIKCNNDSSYNLHRHSFNIKPFHCANADSYNNFFSLYPQNLE